MKNRSTYNCLKFPLLLVTTLLITAPVFAHLILPKADNASEVASSILHFKAGFNHVFPYGYSHLLLLLSMFMVSPKLRSLIWQMMLFILADCIALSFAIFKIVIAPPECILTPCIAFAAIIIAEQNLESKKITGVRYPVIFLVALMHSLVVASMLEQQQLLSVNPVLSLSM